jgi:hypothetical protein
LGAAISVAALSFAVTPHVASAAPGAELWSFWAVSDADSALVVDHARWQDFLDRYLVEAPDGINRVRYRDVTPGDRQLLLDYLEMLSGTDPRALAETEQLAYWINLYNALTVEVVLQHPRKGSILRMGRWILSIGPWDEELITVAGQPLTLNDIEHRILRPIWSDHRIHYVVNCASLGCPNLSGVAYTAENVMGQLGSAETAFVNHPRGVTFTERGRLRLSSIFKWYQEDFAADQAGLLRYLAENHRTLADRLLEYQGGIEFKYDWNLNQAE